MKKEKHKTCEYLRKSFGVGWEPARIISRQKNRIEIAEETTFSVCALWTYVRHSHEVLTCSVIVCSCNEMVVDGFDDR